MPNAITVQIDITTEVALPAEATVDDLSLLVRFALEREGAAGEWNVAIALFSDEALRALHRDFMGDDTVTDVMTFPREPGPWDDSQGGDIAISVERAADQAPEYGNGAWDEVRFLAVHGVLHLCGWDDASDDDRARMLARQRELIAAFDREER